MIGAQNVSGNENVEQPLPCFDRGMEIRFGDAADGFSFDCCAAATSARVCANTSGYPPLLTCPVHQKNQPEYEPNVSHFFKWSAKFCDTVNLV
jgi:hypothetical protein